MDNIRCSFPALLSSSNRFPKFPYFMCKIYWALNDDDEGWNTFVSILLLSRYIYRTVCVCLFFIEMIETFLRDVDWGEVDYLVIDTPPGTSDEHLSTVNLLSSAKVDGAIIITTPQVQCLMINKLSWSNVWLWVYANPIMESNNLCWN